MTFLLEVRRVRTRAPKVEQPDQGHWVANPVLEPQQDAAPGRTGAEVRSDGAVFERVGLLAPGAADVRDPGPVGRPAHRLLRGRVERDRSLRREHRGDRVEQRRLART